MVLVASSSGASDIAPIEWPAASYNQRGTDVWCTQVLTSLEAKGGQSLGSDAVRHELGDAVDPEFSVLFLLAPHVPGDVSNDIDPIDFLT